MKELKEEFLSIQQVETLPIEQTEKERLMKVRIGQGKFKKRLIQRECKCALCGVTDERMLIASHIKPWKFATNKERLDVHNGLLLCHNHDNLFDKRLISFNRNGEIVISPTIAMTDRTFMNVNERMRIVLTEKQGSYMESHYKNLI